MTLPYELHELIIDELRYSFPELKACSLVCRAWLPRCRLHLFRVIRIGPRRVRGIEKEQTRDSFNKFQASFARTFQLPEITSCVRGIFFESCIRDVADRPPKLHIVLPSPKGKMVINPLLSSIQLPFQQLRLLRIQWKSLTMLQDSQNRDAPETDIPMFEQLLDRVDRLEHLAIEKFGRFHANRDILRSIAVHAPKLKTLCFSEFKWYPSFSALVLEDIFDQWNSDFVAQGVPPLRLERLSISATSLETALANEFSELGKELVHLTITNLDTSVFNLWAESFPKLSQLQVFVADESFLLRLLQHLSTQWPFERGLLDVHMNFEAEYIVHDNGPERFNDILSSSVDPVLHGLINETNGSDGIHISMDFVHVDGSEMQQRYIRKAFPLSFATGSLHWRDKRSLEWWFE
ncbi:hypothetical protein BT96DRAFT_924796 [Gymnopus androsaceus JB14]|uniref:F-box domain-containing protein n=1 Tax=Gymnopus androsaceus JB14 TaxID=1447944 RepID=A0A6A4H2M3_9AGAR|nr:hypothetical protein BT96DRAFT_924796 [Gymnopus androsaceus JB14]